MNFELKDFDLAAAAAHKSDALLLLVPSAFKASSGVLSDLVRDTLKAGDLEQKVGRHLALYRHTGVAAPRVLLVPCEDASPRNVRRAVAAGLKAIKFPALRKLLLCFAAPVDGVALRVAVASVAEGTYTYTTTKTKKEGRSLVQLTVACPGAAALRTDFDAVLAEIEGVEFAKEWANRPANHATPSMLAGAAQSLARSPRIQCEVLGPRQVAKLGMGSFMAVAQGSEEELRFIVLRYNGAAATQAPVVLVGKGITFDTGGISLKPAAEMDEMKFDMGGAASVLGVFKALSVSKPAINVVGLIPSCENMPDGRALKPGDVVTSMSGQQIEVLNTDAEGRLILCDALTYAQRFKPAAVVDIATLTGACVIALGGVRSGLFSSHDELAAALLRAGEASQDLCWRMPLDDEYADGLKTNFADVANVGGRAGGAITAAKFLQRFADKYPWAHLDIAGTAWKGGTAKGSTGRPVPLLLAWLQAQASSAAAGAPRRAAPRKRAAPSPRPSGA